MTEFSVSAWRKKTREGTGNYFTVTINCVLIIFTKF